MIQNTWNLEEKKERRKEDPKGAGELKLLQGSF